MADAVWSSKQPAGGLQPQSSYAGSRFYAKVGYWVSSEDDTEVKLSIGGRAYYEEYSGYSATQLWVHNSSRWIKFLSGSLAPLSGTNGDSRSFWSDEDKDINDDEIIGLITLNKEHTSRTVTFKCEVDSGNPDGENAIAEITYTVPAKTSYTVNYNANGGSGAPSKQTKWYGETLTLSSTEPTRTGYTFNGWNTKSDGTGTSYSKGAQYTANSAVTLYAEWQAKSYTVTWNGNGGTASENTRSVAYDSAVGTLPTATRTGYTFLGWYTASSGGTKITTSTKPQGTKTYYAHWQANVYTVTWNGNGGTPSISSQTVAYDSAIGTLPTATRTNHSFLGWFTTSSGGTQITVSTKPQGNKTYYAHWQDVTPPTITAESVTISSSTQINLSLTANVACNQWQYKLDGGTWTTYSSTSGTTGTGSITVIAGTHTIQLRCRRASNNVYATGNVYTRDTIPPTVSFTASNIQVNSFTINATSDVSSDKWYYSIDGGTTWNLFSETSSTSASYTITGLTVNTLYSVRVRARKASNQMYGYSSAKSISTQGGIVHVKSGSQFHDAIPYVKVGSAWKQAICYTYVNGTWRINT